MRGDFGSLILLKIGADLSMIVSRSLTALMSGRIPISSNWMRRKGCLLQRLLEMTEIYGRA
jgi:hypothetical protein